ncbi:MAG TPA: CDGSH iron-sulfur domain-containing protein [Candidatus Binatia bacterium]|jgi:CDGSH-type Zn-finger protein|nr:CDGSH iron-sulfur domain-containing protein [Candidatus Binatia bacterium]
MAEAVTIRVLKNGPYEVAGRPGLIDWEGASYTVTEDVNYLCRCGRSASKPFCDGMHKKAGFQADECVRMTRGR